MSEDIVRDSTGNPIPHPMDSSTEEFMSWLSKARLGDVSNIHNLLCQGFNQMKDLKDELLVKARKEPDNKEVTETLRSMYPMLQRIEGRIFKCRDRIKEIQKIPLS